MAALRPAHAHQTAALSWAAGKDAVAFFHEMRLGKSLTSLRWARLRKPNAQTKLVIAPLTTLPGWQAELAAEGNTSVLLVGSEATRRSLARSAREGRRWCLINPEGLLSSPDLAMMAWDVVIIDESERLKNPQAQITKTVLKMQADIRCLLSGLPSPKHIFDLFTQLLFLYGDEVMGCKNFWVWRDKYFEPVGYDWIPKPGTYAAVQEAKAAVCHCLTRRQVGLDNKKVVEVRYVTLPSIVRKEYARAEKEYAAGSRETKWTLVSRQWRKQFTSGRSSLSKKFWFDDKFQELVRLLEGDLHKQQVVVWGFFRSQLDAAMEYVKQKTGLKVALMNGDTPVADRARYIQDFKRRELRVFFVQMQTGKYGLDLSSASAAVYLSISESVSDMKQSQDRLVSMKKVGEGPNLYVYLLAKDTVEEDIYKSIQRSGIEAKELLHDTYQEMLSRIRQQKTRSSTA